MVILLLHYVLTLNRHRVFLKGMRRWYAEHGLVRDFCSDGQLELEFAEGIANVEFFNIPPYMIASYVRHK